MMDISISSVISLFGVVASLGVAWGIQKGHNEKMDDKLTNLKEDNEDLKNQISKMWLWKDHHDQDSFNKRVEFQKEIGEINARIVMVNGQYTEIKNFLLSISNKITKMEDRLDDLVQKKD